MKITLEKIDDIIRSVYFEKLMLYKRAKLLYKQKEAKISKYPGGYAKYKFKTVSFENNENISTERDAIDFLNQFREAITAAEFALKNSPETLIRIFIESDHEYDETGLITFEFIDIITEEDFYSLLDNDLFDAIVEKFGKDILNDNNLASDIKDSDFYAWFNGNMRVELFLHKSGILKNS